MEYVVLVHIVDNVWQFVHVLHTHTYTSTLGHTHAHTHERLLKTFLIKKK